MDPGLSRNAIRSPNRIKPYDDANAKNRLCVHGKSRTQLHWRGLRALPLNCSLKRSKNTREECLGNRLNEPPSLVCEKRHKLTIHTYPIHFNGIVKQKYPKSLQTIDLRTVCGFGRANKMLFLCTGEIPKVLTIWHLERNVVVSQEQHDLSPVSYFPAFLIPLPSRPMNK